MNWVIRIFFVISVVLGLVVFWPEGIEVVPLPEPDVPEEIVVRPLPVKARELVEKIHEIENAKIDEMAGLWESIQKDDDLRMLALRRWVELEPERAVDHAAGYGEVDLVWKTWGRFDGEAAVKAAQNFNRTSVHSVLAGYGEVNPERVMELIEMFRDDVFYYTPREILDGVMKGIAEIDLGKALDFARAQQFGRAYDTSHQMIAVRMAMDQPMEMLGGR